MIEKIYKKKTKKVAAFSHAKRFFAYACLASPIFCTLQENTMFPEHETSV